MMMTLVLTRSYAGNLMSLLAVRHILQPYQSLQDVLDDPSASLIWMTNSTVAFYYLSAESSIAKEIAEAEREGRIILQRSTEFRTSVYTLVKQGSYALVESEAFMKIITGEAFSKTGSCDFYTSSEGFFPILMCMVGQKYSPLVPAFTKRIMTIVEFGFNDLWLKQSSSNSTMCARLPTKVTVSMPLALTNVWGMFVVLIGGYAVSLLIFGTELLTTHLQSIFRDILDMIP
ncbi:uncharacterized protein [Panulirus ornatus]|uniref:uncharacterized protein n=1 Tax=Panulirus ornatus TaxID=150431 RepID=UPI003A89E88E